MNNQKTKNTDILTEHSNNIKDWFKDGNFKNHILNEKNIPITEDFINSIFKKYKFKHKVKNLELFQLAMIHVSYLDHPTVIEKTARMLKDVEPISDKHKNSAMPLKNEDYDRLEFLGDAVIHNILAEYLYERYDEEKSGFLTKLRSKLEKDESLSKISKKMGLHKYAVIARNLEQSNGRKDNVHLTEDILEAFMGALRKETTFEECKQFYISIVEKEVDFAELLSVDDNYKHQLMTLFHKLKWSKEPKYYEDVSKRINNKEGCVETRMYTTYVTKAKEDGGEIIGIGKGDSMIKSHQNAAYNALVSLGTIQENNDGDDNCGYFGEASDDDSSSTGDYF